MSDLVTLHLEDNDSARPNSSALGRKGEEMAARHLRRLGFRLVVANFKAPIGRNRRGAAVTGEIDLVALEGDVLCFVEVKTRRSDEFAAPSAAVDLRKQRQITRTARIYRRIFGLQSMNFRYDVVSIVVKTEKAPQIELLRGFWKEDKFRKKYWDGER